MAESSLWEYMRKHLSGSASHWVRIENAAETGTPDVNGCFRWRNVSHEVWIELKSIKAFPKKAATCVRIPHYTGEQRQWLLDRAHAGGSAWLFVRVGREYFLFSAIAAHHVTEWTQEQWRSHCKGYWLQSVDWDEFKRKLAGIT